MTSFLTCLWLGYYVLGAWWWLVSHFKASKLICRLPKQREETEDNLQPKERAGEVENRTETAPVEFSPCFLLPSRWLSPQLLGHLRPASGGVSPTGAAAAAGAPAAQPMAFGYGAASAPSAATAAQPSAAPKRTTPSESIFKDDPLVWELRGLQGVDFGSRSRLTSIGYHPIGLASGSGKQTPCLPNVAHSSDIVITLLRKHILQQASPSFLMELPSKTIDVPMLIQNLGF